jgi:antitoxin (DNA-binding transcriptional repressor) of toxin-antitoxin stability system
MNVEINQSTPPLAELLKLVANGEEIVLEESGQPVARLIPAQAPPAPPRRVPGLHAGQGGWVSGGFDEPLPDEFRNGAYEAAI